MKEVQQQPTTKGDTMFTMATTYELIAEDAPLSVLWDTLRLGRGLRAETDLALLRTFEVGQRGWFGPYLITRVA